MNLKDKLARQNIKIEQAKEIINNDRGPIPILQREVVSYCMDSSICTRCHCRQSEPMKKNCGYCLAYKKLHKYGICYAKNKANAGVKKADKRIRSL
jgi:hypothetical protein